MGTNEVIEYPCTERLSRHGPGKPPGGDSAGGVGGGNLQGSFRT